MTDFHRIRDLREDNDMTQTQMGKILICSQSAYSDYERGRADISAYTLIKIADFYNVSVDYLLNRTDNLRIIPYFFSLMRSNASRICLFL